MARNSKLQQPRPAQAEGTTSSKAIALPGAWESANASQALDEQRARSEALENQALLHAQCDDAASACWYMARSLGAARQLEADGEPSLELLFQLLGALADLPAEIGQAPLPEVVGADQLGITELCQQLAMAREHSQDAWVDAELAAPAHSLKH
ncbi:MAG: hypothetical protein ABW005_04675 [Burkholderiaceae bacterium]